MTLTDTYPFSALTVGNYFIVQSHFQHARVAASEYGRKHGMVFSCRKQHDGSMHIYRCASDQRTIDVRGRRGKRRIDAAIPMPTQIQFNEWLATFKPTDIFTMPSLYRQHYLLMTAWTSLYGLQNAQQWYCGNNSDGELVITRGI